MALEPRFDLVSCPPSFWKDEGLDLSADAALAAGVLALRAAYDCFDSCEGWPSSSVPAMYAKESAGGV